MHIGTLAERQTGKCTRTHTHTHTHTRSHYVFAREARQDYSPDGLWPVWRLMPLGHTHATHAGDPRVCVGQHRRGSKMLSPERRPILEAYLPLNPKESFGRAFDPFQKREAGLLVVR